MLVVLSAFALGLVIGVLGMVPRWWQHRERRGARPSVPRQTAPSACRKPPAPQHRPMEFDLSLILLALPLAFVLGWLASRLGLAPAAH